MEKVFPEGGRIEKSINQRVNLIVEYDKEYRSLMAMDPLPVDLLKELAKRAGNDGIWSVVKSVCNEIGIIFDIPE